MMVIESIFSEGNSRVISKKCFNDNHVFYQNDIDIGQIDIIPDIINSILKNGKVIKLSVFCNNAMSFSYVNYLFSKFNPKLDDVLEIVGQPSYDKNALSIQAWILMNKKDVVTSEKLDSIEILTYSTGAKFSIEGSLQDKCNFFLKEVRGKAILLGFKPEQLLRTWFYIGDICNKDGHNYQVVNRSRKDFFDDYFGSTDTIYPASTGIGQNGPHFSGSALYVKTSGNIRVVQIENKDQTSAYNYSSTHSLYPPLFSRAIAIASDNEAIVFVSGTASILSSNSVYIGSPEKQTIQTLKNIESLLNEELFYTEDEIITSSLNTIAMCTVYIKNSSDYELIHRICEDKLPKDAVVNYKIADVCRPDLLMEIEAIAFKKRWINLNDIG